MRNLQELIEPVFNSEDCCGLWRPGVLPGVLHSFQKGWISWSRLWAIFVLETWLRENRISG